MKNSRNHPRCAENERETVLLTCAESLIKLTEAVSVCCCIICRLLLTSSLHSNALYPILQLSALFFVAASNLAKWRSLYGTH